MPADPITKMAKDLCKRFPDAPARTLARRLVADSNGAITLESARSRIRTFFGVCGKQRHHLASVKRAARKPGQMFEMPKSKATPFLPVHLDVTGTVGIISDLHVPYHSEKAVLSAINHLKSLGISCLVINGDLCDFYSISRWIKDPRKRDFGQEMADCRQMIEQIRKQFPDIPILLKQGNHEERYDHWLFQHAPELVDEPSISLPKMLKLDEYEVEYVGEHRPVMIGKLPVLHGHELKNGISAPVNPARGAFMRTLHTVLVGHSHRSSGHCEPDMFGREIFTWSVGCLADLNPDYSRFAKYNHGFAAVHVDKSGAFDVENFRIGSGGEIRSS